MTIRAEWRLGELDLEQDDPFDKVILSTGLKVDLSGGEAAVQAGLVQALMLESELFNRGTTCELKDAGQDCLTCGHYSADPAEELSRLCRLGRDQRFLEGRCEAFADERRAPYSEMATSAECYAEMVSAEYAELAP